MARKSTSSSASRRDQLVSPNYLTVNNERIQVRQQEEQWDTKGEVTKASFRRVQGYPYRAHECSPECLDDQKFRYNEKVLFCFCKWYRSLCVVFADLEE